MVKPGGQNDAPQPPPTWLTPPSGQKDGPEERILASALTEFAAHGFHGARTQAIADAAQVNKALLHYYFRNKENLYQEVLASTARQIGLGVAGIFLDDSGLDEKMERVVDFYFDTFTKRPAVLGLLLKELSAGGEALGRVLAGYRREMEAASGLSPVRLVGGVAQGLGVDLETGIQVFVSIVGMCLTSVFARTFLGPIFDYNEEQYAEFLAARRGVIKQIIRPFIARRLNGEV